MNPDQWLCIYNYILRSHDANKNATLLQKLFQLAAKPSDLLLHTLSNPPPPIFQQNMSCLYTSQLKTSVYQDKKKIVSAHYRANRQRHDYKNNTCGQKHPLTPCAAPTVTWWMKEKTNWSECNQLSSVWLLVQNPIRNPTNLDPTNSVSRSSPAQTLSQTQSEYTQSHATQLTM